jgi:predicted transposase/invertase (TIGR01784 family)
LGRAPDNKSPKKSKKMGVCILFKKMGVCILLYFGILCCSVFCYAVLGFARPITSVEIVNPIQGQDRSEDKLVVLDVLAADAERRRFNIEMQTTLPIDLAKRLTYYNCLNYVRQLGQGDAYLELRPAISI